MTTRTAGPGRLPSVPFPDEARRFDRQILFLAAVGAILLHLGALLLPLPRAPRAEPPETPPPRVIDLNRWILEPPDLPQRSDRRPPRTTRRIPVPMTEAPDLEPSIEPASPTLEPVSADPVPVGPLAPALPPPVKLPMREDAAGLVPPRPLDRPAPDYPAMARRVRAEGLVVLRAIITERGDVASVEVLLAPEPDLGFREAAIEAVSSWRYGPGSYRGLPVAVSMTVHVEFRLH
jgi:protein TonB